MNRDDVMQLFQSQKDEGYKKFTEKLIPGVKNVIGIRANILKDIAKKISKGDYTTYFNEIKSTPKEELFYEEIMVYGLTIGMIKINDNDRIKLASEFVPYIDNWALCDSFCAGLKSVKKNKAEYFQLSKQNIKDNKEFSIRCGVVLLMNYFIDEDYIDELLKIFEEINHEGYYVKMAVAWAISVCYVKFPEKTRIYLERSDNCLDDFTYNKAIQKIRESNRVEKEEKDYLNKLKRKKAIN